MSRTIRFQVGGIPLEINSKLLDRFPNSRLYQYTTQNLSDPAIYIDENPFAFLVILDFLRTDMVYIPRNVNTNLVKRLFAHYGLPLDRVIETETESSLPTTSPFTVNPFAQTVQGSSRMELPPAYQPSAIVSDLKIDPQTRGKEYYTTSLDTQQKLVYKKLEPMIFTHLLPILSQHVDQGHERLRVYFTPKGVQKETIANDTHEEDIGFPKEFFAPIQYGVDVLFLAQPKVMELFKKVIVYSTGIKDISYKIRSMTIRVENDFGLYESTSCDIPVLTIQFPPNCSF